MKQLSLVTIISLCIFSIAAPLNLLRCQANCVLQPPVLRVDFGSGQRSLDPSLSSMENHDQVDHGCPGDGHYAIVSSSSSDCFNGHWVNMNQDHTGGGNMLVVNASYQPGLFFVTKLTGLSPHTTYQLGVWLVNICKPEYECTNIRPNLRFTIENTDGTELAKFSTGDITPTGTVAWLQYSARFTTPANARTLLLKVSNKANGGCGNDFAMDDITLSECIIPKSIVKIDPPRIPVPAIKQPVSKTVSKTVSKPVAQQAPPRAPIKKSTPVITKAPLRDTPVASRPLIKETPVIDLPKPISTRANPIVKQIVSSASEIVIDLYDNGEIDGDTVSVYHNNVLIVPRARLSEKAITFRFPVDGTHPHHELVMVANNLGSIPPNTSLMIITAANKRYEVFISSTEQKNAKVVIDLKSP